MNEDAYVSDEEELECPLCMEEFDISDRTFKPCPCGYQICRFCYNRIVNSETANGCPACRRQYSEETVEFKPLSAEEWKKDQQRIQSRKLKEKEKRESEMASRRHLSNMRVVQKNLVYVIGFSPKSADADLATTLRGNDYFAQYGKINKIVVNKKSHPNGQPTVGVYITYARKEDAARAVAAVDNTMNDGRVLRASFGTTKYCSAYLRQQVCQNPNCMYLHEPGEDLDSYTREDMSTIQHAAKAAEGMHANALAAHHMRRQPSRADSTATSNQEDSAPVALPSTVSWASLPKSSEPAQEAGHEDRSKPETLPPPNTQSKEEQGQIPPPPSQAGQGSIHPSDLLPPPVKSVLQHSVFRPTLKSLYEGKFNFKIVPRVMPGLTEEDIRSARSFPQLFAWNIQAARRPSSPSKANMGHARHNSRYAFATDSKPTPPGFIPPGLATGLQPPGFSAGPTQGHKDKPNDFLAHFMRDRSDNQITPMLPNTFEDPAIINSREPAVLNSNALDVHDSSANFPSPEQLITRPPLHQPYSPDWGSDIARLSVDSRRDSRNTSLELEKPQSKFEASFAKLESLESAANEMTSETEHQVPAAWSSTHESQDVSMQATLSHLDRGTTSPPLGPPGIVPKHAVKSSGTWQPTPPPPKNQPVLPPTVVQSPTKLAAITKTSRWEPSPPPVIRQGQKPSKVGSPLPNAISLRQTSSPVPETPTKRTWNSVPPVVAMPIQEQLSAVDTQASRRNSIQSNTSSSFAEIAQGRSRQNSIVDPIARATTPKRVSSPVSPVNSRPASPALTPSLVRSLSSLNAAPAVSSPLASVATPKSLRIVSNKVDDSKLKADRLLAEEKAIKAMKEQDAAMAAKSNTRKSVPAESIKKSKEQKLAEQREKAEIRDISSTASSQPEDLTSKIEEVAPIIGRARKQKTKQAASKSGSATLTTLIKDAEEPAKSDTTSARDRVSQENTPNAERLPGTTDKISQKTAASDAITALAQEVKFQDYKFFQPIPTLAQTFEFTDAELTNGAELLRNWRYTGKESVEQVERMLTGARRDAVEAWKAVERVQRRNLKVVSLPPLQY